MRRRATRTRWRRACCGSIRIIRKGRGHDGSQRWKCMNCNRTFGVRTNRVMGMSRSSKRAYGCEVPRMLRGLPELAQVRPALPSMPEDRVLMRQRVIECIRRYTPVLRSEAGMSVQLDETYFREASKATTRGSPPCSSCPARSYKRTKAQGSAVCRRSRYAWRPGG